LVQDPQNIKLRRDLGKGYYSLGNLLWFQKQDDAAAEQFRLAAGVFGKLVAEEPSDLENQKALTICDRFLGDIVGKTEPDQARSWYQQALDRLSPLSQQNPGVIEYQTLQAGLLLNLYLLELQVNRDDAAKAALVKARDILVPLAQRYAAVPAYQRDLAVTLRELAVLQADAGEAKPAAANLAESLRLLTELVAKNPNNAEFAEQLAATKATDLTPQPKP
jgi:hypothetical protein